MVAAWRRALAGGWAAGCGHQEMAAAWHFLLTVGVAIGIVTTGIAVHVIGDSDKLLGVGPAQCHIAYHCEQRALVCKSLGSFGRSWLGLPLLMRAWVWLNSFGDEHLVFVSRVFRLMEPLAVSAFGRFLLQRGRRVRGALLIRSVYVW